MERGLRLSVWFVVVLIASALPWNAAQARTIHVDRDAPGPGDGSSWEKAYLDLQRALIQALPGDEIRVAGGVYTPDRGPGLIPGDRSASFELKSGVMVRGGYAGYGEPDPDGRDVDLSETVLSGDLSGDDGQDFQGNEENSYHVVQATSVDSSAVLDGVTIAGGNGDAMAGGLVRLGGGILALDASPTLLHCIIRGNSAEGGGGGMHTRGGSPFLRGCRFESNRAGIYWGDGAGIFIYEGQPLLVDCRFIGNVAGFTGGGMYLWDSDATFVSCLFERNHSHLGGGGMALALECRPLFVNSILRGNTSIEGGAAVYSNETRPTFVNCTIAANKAVDVGGGIRTYVKSLLTLENCIVWGNSDSLGSGEPSQMSTYSGGSYAVGSSCVQGWTGAFGGAGNHGLDPMFVNPSRWDLRATPNDPTDDVWIRGDDRLLSGSPCVDAGDNRWVPADIADLDGDGNTSEPLPLDVQGRARFRDDPRTPDTGSGTTPIVDMGAWEGPEQGLRLSARSLSVPEGGTAELSVSLSLDPGAPIEMSAEIMSGDPDLSLEPASLAFDSSSFFTPRAIIVAAAEDPDNIRGTATIRLRGAGLPAVEVTVVEDDDEPAAPILYVDARASGDRTGASWNDAYVDLQDALETARVFPEVEEIRVAQGVYRPAGPGGNRSINFSLSSGLALRGGYGGVSETNPDRRDIRGFETVLSGDLDLDDGTGEGRKSDNSYHVVEAVGADATAVLDGFTISGGEANGEVTGDYEENQRGGGLRFRKSTGLTVTQCTFAGNSAAESGGGACAFYYNGLDMRRCAFLDNTAFEGAGAFVGDSTLEACLFRNNTAARGGAISCPTGRLTLSDSTIAFNLATGDRVYGAGGIFGGDDTYLEITNCIIWGNQDPSGSSLPAQIDPYIYLPESIVRYSSIEGWNLGGEGNIAEDPRFVDPSAGELHLRPDSPCVDTGLDPAPPRARVDLDGNLRPCGTATDMGAYELCGTEPGSRFSRGDASEDGVMDISDAVSVLGYLFLGTFHPPCLDAADTDDNGDIDLSDPIRILLHLFSGGAPPPHPFPGCGTDPTPDGLGCAVPASCN